MDITSFFEPRDSFFVASMKCQSLLGKAIQEHFTKPEQIASVFSSSPSLQNSSVGANLLTNFVIDNDFIKLLNVVFTPEDNFSVMFSPVLDIKNYNDDVLIWNSIFSFLKKLLTKQHRKYFEASLRSLKIVSRHISNEQLQLVVSNLRRLTRFDLNLHLNNKITSAGLEIIGQNLGELEELRIENAKTALTTPVLHFFARTLKKLTRLIVEFCELVNDEGVFEISKMPLTSLSLLNCWGITSAGCNHIAKMGNLRELSFDRCSGLGDETMKLICSSLVSFLRKLELSDCRISQEGMKFISLLENLEILICTFVQFSDEVIDHFCQLKILMTLCVSTSNVNDVHVSKMCSNLLGLQTLNLAYCGLFTDESLKCLSRLPLLEDLNVKRNEPFSVRAVHSFLEATKSKLKKFQSWGTSYLVYNIFGNPSPPRFLDWSAGKLSDDEVATFFEILGNDVSFKVEEIDLSRSQISDWNVALILKKFRNVKKLNLNSCTNINFENFKLDESCAVEQLDVSHTFIEDKGVENIISSFTNLKFLNLSDSFSFSEASLNLISEKGRNLMQIDLRQCDNISASYIDKFKKNQASLCSSFLKVVDYFGF
jgi:hypothetical protein